MSKVLIEVPYLVGSDINPDASLKNYVGKGKPVLLMVYGSFCPHCTKAMPAVEELAHSAKDFAVAVIQTDGDPMDKAAAQALAPVNKSPGVPAFLGFDGSGKFLAMHQGGRDIQSLMGFGMSLKK